MRYNADTMPCEGILGSAARVFVGWFELCRGSCIGVLMQCSIVDTVCSGPGSDQILALVPAQCKQVSNIQGTATLWQHG
jgi:hypothetical protein